MGKKGSKFLSLAQEMHHVIRRFLDQVGNGWDHFFKLLAIPFMSLVDPCFAQLVEGDMDSCQLLADILSEDGKAGGKLLDLVGIGVDV